VLTREEGFLFVFASKDYDWDGEMHFILYHSRGFGRSFLFMATGLCVGIWAQRFVGFIKSLLSVFPYEL